MTRKKKTITAIVREMRNLYQKGKHVCSPPLWLSVAQCAKRIGITEQQLNHRLNGRSLDESCEETLASLRLTVLGKATEKSPSEPPSVTYARLFKRGVDKKVWSSKTECAMILKVSTDTLRSIETQSDPDMNSRRRAFVNGVLNKMRKKLPLPPSKRQPKHSISGPTSNSPRAGPGSEKDELEDGIRFIIESGNFPTYEGTVTHEELEMLRKRIEELRRCLKRIAQIKDQRMRATANGVLQGELDELFLTYQVFRAVVPTGAAAKIDADRSALARMRGDVPAQS